ncbi:MAG: type 1 glutamine amidotransferase [Acidobacteriota bacterium]
MRWHYLQHVPFEGPAYLDSWAQSRGHALGRTEVWAGGQFPVLDELDGLFVLGGPMSVYEEDRYTWLTPEKAFIQKAIMGEKPILGICLGAQLLSGVLGGTVTENPRKEIGWFPVDLTREGREAAWFRNFPDQFLAFHWHGDRFSIPPGAVHAARSEACAEQAFVHGDRVIGLQFHLESTEESIAALIQHCGEEITCAPYIQDPPTIEEYADRLPETHALLDGLLDALVASL